MAALRHPIVPVDVPGRVLPFLGLVAAGSGPFWVAGTVTVDPSLGLPVDLPVSALMVVCPVSAAAALTYREHGVAGVRGLLRRAVDVGRIRPHWWYVPILGTLPAVAVCSYVVQRSLGRALPEPVLPLGAVAGFTALYLISTACEQLGWTAYATDAMLERHDALTSALVLGGVWALWHVLPYLQAGRSTTWIVWQCVFTVALRIVMTSAYLATRPQRCRRDPRADHSRPQLEPVPPVRLALRPGDQRDAAGRGGRGHHARVGTPDARPGQSSAMNVSARERSRSSLVVHGPAVRRGPDRVGPGTVRRTRRPVRVAERARACRPRRGSRPAQRSLRPAFVLSGGATPSNSTDGAPPSTTLWTLEIACVASRR
jgi:membrane protease YdiL (CAAX protease family)